MSTETASHVIELLERADTQAIREQLSPSVDPSVDDQALGRWNPAMDRLIGSPRTVTTMPRGGSDRVLLNGPRGSVAVDVERTPDGLVTSIRLAPWVADGIRNIVIGCPGGTWNEDLERVEGEPRQLGEFYARLLDMQIVRDDWIKVGKDAHTFPHIAFGDGWSDDRRPLWQDPEYPVQMHLDVSVPDVEEALALVRSMGGQELLRRERSVVVADPFGHPVCLYQGSNMPTLARIVFDCADAAGLAEFWRRLLGPSTIEEAADHVVVSSTDDTAPKLAFQRVESYVPPRWHDPSRPHQGHLDLHFNDHASAKRLAGELGATELPPPRGSCPVYADPAGHPFCLCSNAGGDQHYDAEFLAPPNR